MDDAAGEKRKRTEAAAQRALAEAAERRAAAEAAERAAPPIDVPGQPAEVDGRKGPEPVRFGDWESKGRAVDF